MKKLLILSLTLCALLFNTANAQSPYWTLNIGWNLQGQPAYIETYTLSISGNFYDLNGEIFSGAGIEFYNWDRHVLWTYQLEPPYEVSKPGQATVSINTNVSVSQGEWLRDENGVQYVQLIFIRDLYPGYADYFTIRLPRWGGGVGYFPSIPYY